MLLKNRNTLEVMREQPIHSSATGFCSGGRVFVPSLDNVIRRRKDVCKRGKEISEYVSY